MKKLVLSYFLILLPLVVSADAIKIDGIWYDLIKKAKVAHVTYGNWRPESIHIDPYKGSVSYDDNRYSGSIIIPSKIQYQGEDYEVISIEEKAFYGCARMTSITIPNSITSIGDFAFYWCVRLSSVTLPNSITTITNSTFNSCIALTSITIPENVTSIGEFAFQACNSLSSITIPQGVNVLNQGLFWECENLVSISLPNNLESINSMVFAGCKELKNIKLPKRVNYVGLSAFDECINLNSIEVDNENEYFKSENGILFNKQMTKVIRFPIGHPASQFEIPPSVETICITSFYECERLSGITIPTSVKTIENYAFMSCKNLTSITIPNGVTSIGENAFSFCDLLSTIQIGKDVSSIGNLCFENCKELSNVYILQEQPLSTPSDIFLDCDIEYATLHVPAALIETYKAVEPWKEFKEIVALTEQEMGICCEVKNDEAEIARYSLDGQRISQSKKGLNIVKMKDGTMKKIVVK